jgi:hypothetical protein
MSKQQIKDKPLHQQPKTTTKDLLNALFPSRMSKMDEPSFLCDFME